MKRLAGTADVCGIPFRIFVADDKGHPGLKDLDGCCYAEALEIYVRADLHPRYRREILRHELFHAVWYHAGCLDICQGSLPKAIEEAMTLLLTPHLSRAWDSVRGLKL